MSSPFGRAGYRAATMCSALLIAAPMPFWSGRRSRAPAILKRWSGRSPALSDSSDMVEIKFCGMTRAEDAAYAASVGAAYVGVIFAESPRQLNTAEAREVLAAVPRGVRRVGVFGPSTSREISDTAEQTSLDVVQLHGDPSDAMVRDLRKLWHG